MKAHNERTNNTRGNRVPNFKNNKSWVQSKYNRNEREQFNSDYRSYAETVKVTDFDKFELVLDAIEVAYSSIAILAQKNQDYGPNSIAKAPGGALNGLVVRMHDKIERADNLIRKNVNPNNESLRDTFMDLLNYSIISLLVIDGKWKTK